ncbi:MAG TPA: DUF3892 domain-containing protein [Mucilaginibacter sp.]|nr:DUF3892 domain-containing protein [Mucilaginibacter sp.]
MENWNYYISGIWKQKADDKEFISDVFLHSTAEGFGKGVKTSKDEVVDLLKSGANITTITWNYHLIQWRFGAKVEFDEVHGEYYLRTHPDASTFDDIESSIQMEYILTEQHCNSFSH